MGGSAVTPLLSLLSLLSLSLSLLSLFSRLLLGNFQRVLSVLWEAVLDQLREHSDTNSGEKMPLFYDRLHEVTQDSRKKIKDTKKNSRNIEANFS